MLKRFVKNWTLPISITLGIVGYYVVSGLGLDEVQKHYIEASIAIIQPALIFSMLFLTFCKIRVQEMRFTRWHLSALFFQLGLFLILAIATYLTRHSHSSFIIESAMVCIICPTATAAPVITEKLGGDPASLSAYTILINLAVALLFPLVAPLIHPDNSLSFCTSFLLIMSKVFPLLICPILLSVVLRQLTPKTVELLARNREIAFYLWAIALALAIAVTTKHLRHSELQLLYKAGIGVASLIACAVQFAFGRYVGKKYGYKVSASQACGQKNTVLAIWISYTFLSPVTSVAGGFYSIWHNVWNSYQLYQQRKQTSNS